MADRKKGTYEAPAPASDKKKALETALSQIEKNYGKGAVMRLGDKPEMQVDAIPTGSLALDAALGIGGVPRGRIIEAALKIARKNVQDQGLGGRVSCVAVDALQPAAPFLGQFDLIVSNPPYVTRAEMQTLPRSVRAFEPAMALDGGEDGLDFYRAIVQNFQPALKPGGYLCFEFGMGQLDAVCEILTANQFEIVQTAEDAGGIMRAVLARDQREDME